MLKMYGCIYFCVILAVQYTFAKRQVGTLRAADVGPKSDKCRECRVFFKGDNKQLCTEFFCNTKQTRPNVKTVKRCNSCRKKFQGKKQRTCQKTFCYPQVKPDPGFIARAGLGITLDILCQYCYHIANYTRRQRCILKYCL